ncbi:MAG: hypothetical protein EOO63_13025 [Hymenobacter sp.]|nr:MAG: hypothetical protein EOO63_13025 [Hymenobacter sp.]
MKLIFFLYSVGFLAGTYTHVKDLVANGFLASPVPLGIGLFWNVLTVLDPFTVLLLWWRPKAGIALAAAIMVVDVSVNTDTYLAGYFRPPTPHMVPLSLLEQALFGLFVLLTAPLAYQQLALSKLPLTQGAAVTDSFSVR